MPAAWPAPIEPPGLPPVGDRIQRRQDWLDQHEHSITAALLNYG